MQTETCDVCGDKCTGRSWALTYMPRAGVCRSCYFSLYRFGQKTVVERMKSKRRCEKTLMRVKTAIGGGAVKRGRKAG